MKLHHQLIIGISFIVYSCDGEHTHVETSGPNESNNVTVMHGQNIETQSAFNTLENLFDSPEDFRIKTIYSSEIDRLALADGTVPKEIFFYYKLTNNDTLFCSKFFVQHNVVSTIFHLYNEQESQEYEAVIHKSDSLLEKGFNIIDKVYSGTDSTK